MFTVHCAYNVTVPDVAKFETLAPSKYAVPVPSAFVFHPANVYPEIVYPFEVKFLASSYFIAKLAIVPVAVSPVGAFELNAIE